MWGVDGYSRGWAEGNAMGWAVVAVTRRESEARKVVEGFIVDILGLGFVLV